MQLPWRGKALLYLLHLKFDGRFDLIHLGHQVLIVSEERREFAGFVQTWTQDSRNLLDQGLGSQEGIVLLRCEERTKVGKDGPLVSFKLPTPSLKLTAQLRLRCSISLTCAFPRSQRPD